MLDRNGLVIAHKNKTLVLKNNIAAEYPWGKNIIERKSGVMNYEFMGAGKIASFKEIPSTGWIISATANESDILAESGGLRDYLLMGGGIVIVILSMGLVWLVVILVTRPLAVMESFLQRASLGNTTENPEHAATIERLSRRQDEFGRTIRAATKLRHYLNTKAEEAQQIAAGDFTVAVDIASEEDRLCYIFHNYMT